MTPNLLNEHIPLKPLQGILYQYCICNGLPYQVKNPVEMMKAYEHYNQTAKHLN